MAALREALHCWECSLEHSQPKHSVLWKAAAVAGQRLSPRLDASRRCAPSLGGGRRCGQTGRVASSSPVAALDPLRVLLAVLLRQALASILVRVRMPELQLCCRRSHGRRRL